MNNNDRSDIIRKNSTLIGNFVEDRVGFRLTDEDSAPFKEFVNWFSLTSNSTQIQRLKAEEKPGVSSPFPYFINKIAVDTQKGFSASVYHFQNMRRISEKLITDIYADPIIVAALHEMFPPGHDGLVAPHNPAILDFEFQAYLVSVRRTLEYLSRALNSYFLKNGKRLRTLKKSLLNAKPIEVSKALIDVIDRNQILIDGFLSNANQRTDRDILVHDAYVPFGCLNIKKDGARFYGKNFPHSMGNDSMGVIEMDLNNLRILIREFVSALIKGDQLLPKN